MNERPDWRVIIMATITSAMLGRAAALGPAPVPFWMLVVGFLLIGAGAMLLVRRPGIWTMFEACVGTLVGTATGAGLGHALLLAVYGPVGAFIVVVLGSGAGLAIRQVWSRRRPVRALRWIGGLCLLAPLLSLPYAIVARGVTVHAQHPHRGDIDLRSASFGGIGIGADAQTVQWHFGRVASAGGNVDPEPPAADHTDDAPPSFDYGPPEDTSLRYPYVSFALRRGRVRWIQIDDELAATPAGIGPGDSIALVRRSLPSAHCGQDSLNSEDGPPLDFPYCQIRLRRDRWLTFFGTYSRLGTPITAIWLSTYRLE